MTSKSDRQRWTTYVPAASALVSLGILGARALQQWHLSEAVAGFAALLATAIAGHASLYLSRLAKSIPSHKRVFISYSYDQQELAIQLRQALLENGAYVWLDKNDLQPGADISATISSAIESSNRVVALLSKSTGPHLAMELKSAVDKKVPITAILSSNVGRQSVPEGISQILYMDQIGSFDALAKTALQD